MGNNPMVKSALTGAVLQALLVVIGNFVPSIGSIPNFYSIGGTLLSVVTGALFAKWSPGAGTGQAAGGGAAVGGISALIGGTIAVMTGLWPGFKLVQMLFPVISGAVGGGIGGLIGRFALQGQPRASAD